MQLFMWDHGMGTVGSGILFMWTEASKFIPRSYRKETRLLSSTVNCERKEEGQVTFIIYTTTCMVMNGNKYQEIKH